MGEFIPLSVPNLKGNELKYVTEAVETEWVSTAGSFVDRFEASIANYVGVPKAAAVQSGTAGLHLSLICCGVMPGDEVIVPTLTFIAAANPVKYIGADPVFMDCDDTLCIDPSKLESFCSEECIFNGEVLVHEKTGKHVRAIVVVHVFGNLAHMEEIMDIAQRYNLKVIEDATEALGTRQENGRYAGKYAGTIGDIGVFSFNGNKIITCGGGGAVVSNDSDVVEHVKHLSTQAKADTVRFVHDEIGFNYRMTNVQAAIGLGQIEQLEEFIELKEHSYRMYEELGVKLLPFREDIRSNRWFFNVMTDRRDELIQVLADKSIQARPIWQLIHTLPMYDSCDAYQVEHAPHYWEQAVSIPCSTNLSDADIQRVAEVISSISSEKGY